MSPGSRYLLVFLLTLHTWADWAQWTVDGVSLDLATPYVFENGIQCTIELGCLLKVNEDNGIGNDALGSYAITTVSYTTSSGASVLLSYRDYEDGTRVYKQQFPDGLKGCSTGNRDLVSTAWPRLVLPSEQVVPELRFITPGGLMAGWTLLSYGKVVTSDLLRFRDGQDGGIVVLFQPGNVMTSSLVVSALTEPMATNVFLNQNVTSSVITVDWGVQGAAEDLPKEYVLEVIAFSDSHTVTSAVMGWGKMLLQYHNTSRQPDLTADYLSYWTDNGAAHYYNPLPFLNFQDALLHVHNYTVTNKIPVRYLQMDSWWYHKGYGFGLKNWTEIDQVLPDGLKYLHEVTGWPLIAHNRYFGNDTDYAMQNGGKYPFTMDEDTAYSLPLDRHFWEDLLDGALVWGLATYEQDWLDRQYLLTSALHTNVTLGASWLDDMGGAALERGLNVQYCMSLSRHLVHSARLPAVTQIRVSDDYILNPDQWRIGVTTLFAHALGLRAYKDVFWTSRVNENVVFNDCVSISEDNPNQPWVLSYTYGGRIDTTVSGANCLPWSSFGWDNKYPFSSLISNFCRNPDNLHQGAFCYTKAAFDLPETQWEWEFCDIPVCDYDCYTFNGVLYQGPQNVTSSGTPCVDWNGVFLLQGAVCRNPTSGPAPWCFTAEDHSHREFCDNKCVEAIEPNPYLQGAVATLSGGPVGLGDRAEQLDIELIMKSVNAEGLILRPTKPLTVSELHFLSQEYHEIWTGYSTIVPDASAASYGIIFLAEVENPSSVYPLYLNLEEVLDRSYVLWQNYPPESYGVLSVNTAGEALNLPSCAGPLSFCLLYTSPVLQVGNTSVAILGERAKWTPVASGRIVSVYMEPTEGVGVVVAGLLEEVVTLTFWSDGEVFDVTCDFAVSGIMVVDTATRVCK